MPQANGWVHFIKRESLRLVIGLVFCMPFFALAQSADEPMLRTLTEKFFAAYQTKDLAGLMQRWSAKSPERSASQQSFQQTFAAVDKIELTRLAIGKLSVDGDKASEIGRASCRERV